MSAFDIAGAVVWTPLAVLCWAGFRRAPAGDAGISLLFVMAVSFGFASIFCIARLLGATL